MINTGQLYRTNRGNQNQKVGLIIKGASASVQALGSQSLPESLTEMEDLTNAQLLDSGTWAFEMFPEYVYFNGTADSIEIVGMSVIDLNTLF